MKDRQFRYTTFTMILPVFNEEARLQRVIEYYRGTARLVVVDNFSTDRTLQIARDLGAEVVQFKNPGSTQTPECMRYFATLAQTDYVLFLACSEFLPSALLERFDEVARSRSHDVVSCVRDSYTCGKLIPLWGKPFRRVEVRTERFMNIRAIDMASVSIHGSFQPLDRSRMLLLTGEPRYRIAHLRDSDAASLLRKSVDYASVEAQQRFAQGRPLSGLRLALLIVHEAVRFFSMPLRFWNRTACREIWARMVMHSAIFWAGWELRSGRTLEDSYRKSDALWRTLVSSHGDRKQEHDR